MTKDNYNLLTNPLWYKDAIIYQLHVRSFYDSNGDGIGDFRGLIEKLDYIQRLGVNTLWLLPFFPSPLRDGGYDIADFKDIHPSYGTFADFKKFVREAHKRGLRIIIELVINHTSIEHKWFQRARKARPGTVYRDFYVWSDTAEKFKDARIIFQDYEVSNWAYDHEAKVYYWHRFYSHQPDLNFENPRVQKEIFKILDFWFKIGVDGFRLDAVPYLFQAEGTNCENLPETHQFLKKLRKHVDENYQDKLLLAEANQWPNDAYEYFGEGDECHMAFHFPLMPRLYMALRMEDRFPVVDILEQTPQIPENCQWAIFLRNHDELTLEMVSDEERDFMYKSFAKDPRERVNVGICRRLFPLFGGDNKTIELLNFLLFSLPGTPIVYYGDEIGMGDNYYLGDRDGVRTPMQWSPDKNAGFSDADPQKLSLPVIIDHNYHYTTVNVENRESTQTSFLWWMRRVINKRKKYTAFGRGNIKFVNTNNPKILAFIREYKEEAILIMVNLSRYSQYVELDLHDYAGCTPTEVFSRNDFPIITDEPWPFAMQFKNYFWFELRKVEKDIDKQKIQRGKLDIDSSQWASMKTPLQSKIKDLLNDYIIRNKWIISNVRKLRDVNIIDVFSLQNMKIPSHVFLLDVDLIEESNDVFLIPVSLAVNKRLQEIKTKNPEAVIAHLNYNGEEAILYDGTHNDSLLWEIFNTIRRGAKLKGIYGEIEGMPARRLKKSVLEEDFLKSHVVAFKRSNTSIIFEDKFFFKMYRRPQEGENPEVEIVKNVTRHTNFENIPAYMGRLDYKNPKYKTTSLALLVDLVPNVGDAWNMTQTSIDTFFDKVLSEKDEIFQSNTKDIEDIDEFIDPFFIEMIEIMGKRTAQMHNSINSVKEAEEFEPEPFSLLYQKSLYQSMRTFVKRQISWVKKNMNKIENAATEEMLKNIINDMEKYFSHIQNILEKEKLNTWKTRIHGNYKLDKLLFTGKDFMITDFEGEVEYPSSVRRIKHCPLKDVASMFCSFHYAIYIGYFRRKEFAPEDENYLRPLIDKWLEKVSRTFFTAYTKQAREFGLIPENQKQTEDLLNVYIFEKAVKELRNFAQNEPQYTIIPIKAMQRIENQVLENG